jgi:hypothetical protein
MKNIYMIFFIFMPIFFFSNFVSTVKGQEVFFDFGSTKYIKTGENSFYLDIAYAQWWDNFGLSFSWLNDGHFEEDNIHHRDGQSVQAWVRKFVIDKKLAISGGIGPYLYFDTTRAVQDQNYRDEHGVGIEYSLAGVWYLDNRLIVKVQGNYIDPFDSFSTFSASVGLGYLLGDKAHEAEKYENLKDNYKEITVFFGGVIVNSFDSEKNLAEAIEYRQKLLKYVDWSVLAINEGDAELINRKGIASQLWLTRSFFDDSLSLGIGAGPYVFEDSKCDKSGLAGNLAGLSTFNVGYYLSPSWLAQISWSRVFSDYNRDTDLILFGLGYRFH